MEVGKAHLPARLLAERVPVTVVEQRHARLKEEARLAQRPVAPEALELAQWTLLLTNAEPTLLDPVAAALLYRVRWQIECLFNLWKTTLALDQWQSTKPMAILCELYAKLLGAILTHWLILVGCWENPAHSLVRATQTIRKKIFHIAAVLACLPHLIRALASLVFCLQHLPPVQRSHRNPRTFERLEDYDCLS